MYVGSIPFTITEADLQGLFSAKGVVSNVNLIEDRETGRPRGFAFVTMATGEEAETAVRDLDGQDFQGRRLTVNLAQDRAGFLKTGGSNQGGGSRHAAHRG